MGRKVPKYIMDFVRVIAPADPVLYVGCSNERTLIQDATTRIRELTDRVVELEEKLAEEEYSQRLAACSANDFHDKYVAEKAENARLTQECDRLHGWLQAIDGGDNPCTDVLQLRQWAYEAATLGRPAPE